MKLTFTIIFLSLMVLVSCNDSTDKEVFVDKLLIEKNKEIENKYSNDLAGIEYVKDKSKLLNKYFEKLLTGKENYYDSVFSIWQLRNDDFSKEQLNELKSNINKNQIEIKLIQYRLLCSLENYYHEMFYKTMGVTTVVKLEKNTIKVGDTLKAKIFLGMQISQYKDYSVILENDTINSFTDWNLPLYEECFHKQGNYIRQGKILIKSFNRIKEFPFSFAIKVEN